MADLRGRRLVYNVALAFFAVFCGASAAAPNGAVLIATRVLQGAAAAPLLSTTVAMVTLAYPAETRGRALGFQAAGVYLGITLGPVLGGIITQNLGWRALFLVTGGLGAVNLVLSLRKLRLLEWREAKTAPFDVWGSVVWVCALSALIKGFSYLPGGIGYGLIVVGIAGLAGFIRVETRAPDPILNVDLLRRNRVFASANTALLINYAATTAMSFLVSLYLLYNRHLGAQTAGFVLVTGPFVQAAVSPAAGRLAERLEARFVAAAGMALCVAGLLAFAFLTETTPYWYVITFLCVLGLGFGFFSTPHHLHDHGERRPALRGCGGRHILHHACRRTELQLGYRRSGVGRDRWAARDWTRGSRQPPREHPGYLHDLRGAVGRRGARLSGRNRTPACRDPRSLTSKPRPGRPFPT